MYTELANGLTAPPIAGRLTPRAALSELLKGTGLRYEFLDERTVAIYLATETAAPTKTIAAERITALQVSPVHQGTPGPIRLAQAHTPRHPSIPVETPINP